MDGAYGTSAISPLCVDDHNVLPSNPKGILFDYMQHHGSILGTRATIRIATTYIASDES